VQAIAGKLEHHVMFVYVGKRVLLWWKKAKSKLSSELQPRSVPAAALQPLYNYRYEPIPISRT